MGIYFDENDSIGLREKLDLLNATEIKTLDSLSKSIGLSITLLYKLLIEIYSENSKSSSDEDLNLLINTRNKMIEVFFAKKKDFEKFYNKLKIYDEIEKVVKLNKDYEFEKNRQFIKENKLFERHIFSVIALEIADIDEGNDMECSADSDLEDQDEDEDEVADELSTQINNIGYDFKFNNLTQDLKIKRVAINELKRATDDVNILNLRFLKFY